MNSRKEEILDIAQHLTQLKGLNGFSYIDISNEIGIKTSSIHYYFKTKNDLVIALIKRYHLDFKLALKKIDTSAASPSQKLRSFSEIFKSLAEVKDKFCLCGMMAAEIQSISAEAQQELVFYFKDCTDWLSINFAMLGSKMPHDDAKAYMALLEGALLMARMEKSPGLITQLCHCFISKFES